MRIIIAIVFLLAFVGAKSQNMEPLSVAEARKLIKDKSGRKDASLFGEHRVTVYHLNDKSLVVEDHGYYSRFADMQELEALLQKYVPTKALLLDKNPYGKEFPKNTSNLIRYLLNELKISSSYPLNVDLLKKVDQQLKRRGDSAALKDDYFLHLIALVGEVLIKDKSARWEMRLSEADNKTWTPYLVYKDEPIEITARLFENMHSRPEVEEPIFYTYDIICDIMRISIN